MLNGERYMAEVENIINSTIAMKKFCGKCTSDDKMDELFEYSSDIDGGRVTVVVEVQGVPIKKVDYLADTINRFNTDLCYRALLEKAKAITGD